MRERPPESLNETGEVAKNKENNGSKMAVFQWTAKKSAVALALAEGFTRQQVSEREGVPERTIYNWLAASEFSEEVDRLSLMVGVAARAERLRIAQKIVREKMSHGILASDKDLLDWLKFAQSETDGAKLGLAEAFAEAAASLAGRGSESSDPTGQAADRSRASEERDSNLS